MKITPHAVDRIKTTLHGIFDREALNNMKAIDMNNYQVGKFYITIKRFDSLVHIDQDNRNGDCLVAIVRDGMIVTVMLTKSWRTEYFSDGKFIK